MIAYHARQSFAPGEITPEEANAVGYELAMRFTKGRHAFIVCTHVDRAHVHNHVVWNSTALDCKGKWRNFFRSGRALAKLSDLVCLEHGLSVIENPAPGNGRHYGAWLGGGRMPSRQDRLRADIDAALESAPATFEDFLSLMREAGYEIKTDRKHIAFRRPEWKQPARMDTLRGDHTEASVRDRIQEKAPGLDRAGEPGLLAFDEASVLDRVHGRPSFSPAGKKIASAAGKNPSLLIDVQEKLRQGKGEGYRRWATAFNLKQAARTLIFLQEQSLDSYDSLKEKTETATKLHGGLSTKIQGLEERLAANAALQKHILNYSKTRDIYVAYRKAGYSKNFKAQHEAEILLHQAAKQAFDELGFGRGKRIPTVATLRKEFAEALEEKKTAYAEYRRAKTAMRELLTAKENVDRLLNISEGGRERDAERKEL